LEKFKGRAKFVGILAFLSKSRSWRISTILLDKKELFSYFIC
jgi:hypothetical protein